MTPYKTTNPIKTKHACRRNSNFVHITYTGNRTSQKDPSLKDCGRSTTVRFVLTFYM